MSKSINLLIVEDDTLIAQDLKEILEEVGYTEIYRVRNYEKAANILATKSIDLVLLDINLREALSGIHLATHINQHYQLPFIYITSYSDAATIAEVKQTKPAGFLLKPYSKPLLLASIEIALFNFSNQTNAAEVPAQSTLPEDVESDLIINNHLLVKDNYHYVKVSLADIFWFESDKNYVLIKTVDKKYMIRCSLKKLLDHLPSSYFVKCHKQYIININHVESFSTDDVTINGEAIPVSRVAQEEVLNKLKK
jgi:two-component system response regulator LytT